MKITSTKPFLIFNILFFSKFFFIISKQIRPNAEKLAHRGKKEHQQLINGSTYSGDAFKKKLKTEEKKW